MYLVKAISFRRTAIFSAEKKYRRKTELPKKHCATKAAFLTDSASAFSSEIYFDTDWMVPVIKTILITETKEITTL